MLPPPPQLPASDSSSGSDQQSTAAAANGWAAAANGTTRFFIDEGFFEDGETEVLRAHIAASEGRMVISGESSGAFLSVKGYYVPDKWDVYFTVRQACQMAFPHMRPGQRASCIPGVRAITLKKDFVQSWQRAYGELAFSHIPRSYTLPEQYWIWRSHMLQSHSPPDTKWVLKANIHRGKGVSVVPQPEAVERALERAVPEGQEGGPAVHRNILVQSYLNPQMVIAGRSSYLRVWLLVTSVSPLRAYLFKGGFAIFGKQRGGNATTASQAAAGSKGSNSSSSSSSSSGDDLIVNLWIQDREKSPIWSLAQLESYLEKHPDAVQPDNSDSSGAAHAPRRRMHAEGGKGAAGPKRRRFADAWADMREAATLALAAGLPSMRAAAANASAPHGGMFEYFGLDFVLDATLRPRMLEVNAVPSMARRRRSGCAGRASTAECGLSGAARGSSGMSSSSSGGGGGGGGLVDGFDEQKEAFVHDMLGILGLPVDSTAAAGPAGGAAHPSAALRAAAAAASGAARDRRRPLLASVPPELQPLLCPSGSGGERSKAATSESSSGGGDGGAFACANCLTADDLAALAEVEGELEAMGRFEPAHDLILAHRLNALASGSGTPAMPAGGNSGSDGDSSGSGVRDSSGGGKDSSSSSGGRVGEKKAPYLQDDVTVWQRLHRTWAALTEQRLPVRDGLEVMRHFTTSPALPVAARLPLGARDYLMSAWLRARGDAALKSVCGGKASASAEGGGKGGGALDACTVARLKRVVEHCYL